MANNNPQFPGIQPHRPSIIPMGHPQSAAQPMPMQFRPVVPPQQPPPFIPVGSQQFLPVGRPNIGVPSHNQQPQFSQPSQQLPARPGLPGHIPTPQPPQSFVVPDVQPNGPITSTSPQPPQVVQAPNNYMPGYNGPGMPISLPYSISAPSGQLYPNNETGSQYQPASLTNMTSFTPVGPTWQNLATPAQPTAEQTVVAPMAATPDKPSPVEKAPSDWIEHNSRSGKRYYYNRKTKLSHWEKPVELMTPIEKADASTGWKEVTAPCGRKYYYNKAANISKWRMPDVVKLARERILGESANQGLASFTDIHIDAPFSSLTDTSLAREQVLSPVAVAPVVIDLHSVSSSLEENVTEKQTTLETVPQNIVDGATMSVTLLNTDQTKMGNSEELAAKDVESVTEGNSVGDIVDAKEGTDATQLTNITAVEDKLLEQEPIVYENKQEAKNAFWSLLESVNVASDWTWDQAMRLIINDRRYGALRTLGERKQAFNELVGQKKKQEAEERRNRQKKAREDFKKMLEESEALTSSTKWSKAVSIFEDDERFKAVERLKDREDLFDDYLLELQKKERAKALEEHKKNKLEYIEFLKSCDFIKADSQWRKVQDRLEADERCSRLEKIDRLEIFQEYINDLEKEEEEKRKLRMEELRKAERKNRDEFRKLMEGHIGSGLLTMKTSWREYLIKVKDLPAFLAVSSNTSGSTAKELFEDVIEELEKQFLEDKDRIKAAVKTGKPSIASTWTLEDFKAAIMDLIGSPPVSDANLKVVFDELLEKVREKEEKEAKRRKRIADDFYESLCANKDISSSSTWEDFRKLFEDKHENWSNLDEGFFREIFEKYIAELQEKAREKERKRREDKARKEKDGKDRDKRKEKQRRDKDRSRGKEKSKKDGADSENDDRAESYSFDEKQRSGRDKGKKHRKRHQGSLDGMSLEESEKDRSKNFRRHGFDHKRLKQSDQFAAPAVANFDNRHKRFKRDHGNGSYRHGGGYEDQKERDFIEEGEVW